MHPAIRYEIAASRPCGSLWSFPIQSDNFFSARTSAAQGQVPARFTSSTQSFRWGTFYIAHVTPGFRHIRQTGKKSSAEYGCLFPQHPAIAAQSITCTIPVQASLFNRIRQISFHVRLRNLSNSGNNPTATAAVSKDASSNRTLKKTSGFASSTRRISSNVT